MIPQDVTMMIRRPLPISNGNNGFQADFVHHPRNQQSQQRYKSANTQSLGALFAGFISYYSDRSIFDSVISVRTGQLMKRTDPEFARSSATSMDTFICVEEPFNHSNTSHSVHNDFMFNFIVKSFRWTRESILKMKMSVNDFV